MINVLIVDDEVLVRNNVRTLINWEENGFHICGEATNGKNAVDMIEKTKPHIIILDISMAIMDGVELSYHISQKYKDILMIVLSSYDDYDYVRQTMKNGAIDYILKHQIDSNALLGILNKGKEQIKEKIRQKDQRIEIEKKWEVVGNAIKENYLKDLVLGINNEEDQIKNYFDMAQLQLGTHNIMVVAMQVSAYLIITNDYSDKEKSLFIRSIKNICTQVIDEVGQATIAYLSRGRFVLLFSCEEQRSEARIYQRIYKNMDRISTALSRYLNVQVVWGASSLCGNYSNIPEYYQKACKVINGTINISVDSSEQQVQQEGNVISLNIHQEKNILAAIEMKDIHRIFEIISEVFQNIKKHKASHRSIQIILTELLTIAIKAAKEYGIQVQNIYDKVEYKKQCPNHGEEIENIQKWIEGVYSRLIKEANVRHTTGQYSNYVNTAIVYLREHYNEDLSLQEAAEVVGITAPYLSRLFREETGESFIFYLNSIRVEMASKLIEEGEKNVKMLCEKVGFNSYNYFFTVFKDIMGCTPLTYAKSIKKISRTFGR